MLRLSPRYKVLLMADFFFFFEKIFSSDKLNLIETTFAVVSPARLLLVLTSSFCGGIIITSRQTSPRSTHQVSVNFCAISTPTFRPLLLVNDSLQSDSNLTTDIFVKTEHFP